MLRRSGAVFAAIALLLTMAVSAVSAGGLGPPHTGFWVDGDPYRTVGTPTDFSGTGAPDSSFDRIYRIDTQSMNVAEAKQGDRDYNGGRWMVLQVTWTRNVHELRSAEEVLAAAGAGDLTIDPAPIREFLCPVIPADDEG